jgi:hypothetical protein
MSFPRHFCLSLIALSLAACSEQDSPTVPANASTSGLVLGSYFRNANVCLDSNNNGQCDSSEISARTDNNGAFTLAGSGSNIVAEIGSDAREYDPERKIETPVSSKLVLRAPKEASGLVSLHSTAVLAEMENNQLSYNDARAKVAIAVGVSTEKLLRDFNKESDLLIKNTLKSASDEGIKRIQAALKNASASDDLKTLLASATLSNRYYQTKTPYRPQQDSASYEAAPADFSPVYTQLVARHGSRGLSSMKYDLAIYNMWKKAQDEGALTPLAATLGPDVLKIMKANFLLGYGVKGISTPGYGNETQTGIDEHTQLAARMVARLPAYWKQIGDSASSNPRQIVTVTSGVDRAVDSGYFFTQSLKNTQPNLASLVSYPAAPAYPDNGSPIAQPTGTNRFMLYFHKLIKATDLVSKTTDPLYATYNNSLAYQAYKASDSDLQAKQAGLLTSDAAKVAGRAVMERLFTKAFIDKIEAGTYSFANTGSFSYSSDDGKYSATLSGDGKTKISSLAEAANLLYELYVIAPAMKAEAGVDFTPYLNPNHARSLAFINDASDFYDKGPGITEKGDVTYRMAQTLVDDVFGEMDNIARGKMANAAKLRFAHAEIIIPFASRMGLKNVLQQVPLANTFSYENNPWRGEAVSPMAANMQIDLYKDAGGKLWAKMLYNEKETDFKASCDNAKRSPSSKFYDYSALRSCYGYGAL